MLDFIEYSISPWVRCMACAVLGAALFLLYRWDPERSTKTEERDRSCTELAIEPDGARSALRAFSAAETGRSETHNEKHPSVVQLQQYLDHLRQHQIGTVDHV